tara:strand:+ start:3533 stop:7198 length:3666 start_codon:yes stop_codon:yes gene_type:complete
MKLLILGLIAVAILVYLIYNQCWKVHRCTPFPNMDIDPDKRGYGMVGKPARDEIIGKPEYEEEGLSAHEKAKGQAQKDGIKAFKNVGGSFIEGMSMPSMPAFDKQATMEMDYIKDRKKHFEQREDDPMGMMDISKELTQFKDLKKAGWDYQDKKDLSGNIRKLEKAEVQTMKETDMSKTQKDCIMVSKCGDLNDGKCGYCASSGSFSTSNKKGTAPLTDVCEAGQYSNTKEGCEKAKDRMLCNSIISCGDLYGEAEQKCGYCPTTGKIMVMKKVGNKLVPKYSEDSCNYSGGLLTAKDCKKFAKEHPCITPYHGTGKHSRDCYVKLWKNSGCTGTKPYNNPFDDLVAQKGSSYQQIGSQMKELYKKTQSRDLVTVMKSYPLCYNRQADLDPCDPKYTMPYGEKTKEARKLCANKIFKEQGCDIAGKKHPDKLSGRAKEDILKMDSNAYKQVVQGYVKGANKEILNVREYAAKKLASQACYGTDPPKPDGIREGDYVTMDWAGGVLWGYLLDYRSKKRRWGVMWTKYVKGGKEQRRMGMNQEEQKKWFGWPGRKAKDSSRRSLGDDEGLINGTKLVIKTRCSTGNSLCGKSCNAVLNNLLDKYPPPQDCVVSAWSAYGQCSEDCGGGKKTKTRTIRYPPKRGGAPCPKLTNTIGCNFEPCTNKNFTEATKADVKGKAGVTHVQIQKTGYVQVQEIEVYDRNGKINLEGGSASQSSSYYWWFAPAKRVMDGNKKDYNRWWMSWRKGNSAHTLGGLDQWVRVALPKKQNGSNLWDVTKVVVYGRADCSWGNCGLSGAKIQLWNMNVKPAKLIEQQKMSDDRRQAYYFGAKEKYYCSNSTYCETKTIKVGDDKALNKFKKKCKAGYSNSKVGKGSCLEARFEKSKAYPKGGDCDWYGYKWHGWDSRHWPVEKCADICANDKNCNRFTFGATNVYGGWGLGCRTSKSYNTGYCPITTDRYKSNGWRWWGTSNFWGGQVYDKKGKMPKKDMQYIGDFQDCGDNWWMNKYALSKRWSSPYGKKFTKDYSARTKPNAKMRGKWGRDLGRYAGRTAYWGPGNDARVCQWRCRNYKYFGLQWYGQCFCSNSFGRYFQHHDKGNTKDEGRKKGDVWRRQSFPRRVNWWWSYYGGCRNRVYAGPRANPEVLADNTFGRPNPQPKQGTYKAGQWSDCAKEGQTCKHSGLVRYGLKNRWVYRSGRDGSSLPCTNATFGGDPVPGSKKVCEKLKSW